MRETEVGCGVGNRGGMWCGKQRWDVVRETEVGCGEGKKGGMW